jgi:uncharacterized delta-60 repeat protein
MKTKTIKRKLKLARLLWAAVLSILVACGTSSSPSWTLALNPNNPALTVTKGSSTTLQAVFTPKDGFSGNVAIAVEKQDGSAAPTGVTITPATVNVGANPTNATLTIQTANSTVAGNYNLRVKASSTGQSKTANFSLNVQNASTPALNLSLNPDSLNIIRGDGVSTTMTLTPQNGFSGNVNLVLEKQDGSAAPAGLSISPTTATVSSGSTDIALTLTSTGTTPTGAHSLRVRATGTGLAACGSHCANLSLVVGTKVELDPTFDGDGIVITAVAASQEFATDLIIQPDGKLVVAGSSFISRRFDFMLVRYNPDGSLDTSFDTDGIAISNLRGDNDGVSALTLQPDGKILVAGYSRAVGAGRDDLTLVRYNSDGSLDTSFDTDGVVISPINGFAQSLILQSDGKIIISGITDNGSDEDFALLRYNPDGSLDTSFDTDGFLTTDFGARDFANAMALQPDGKILLAGYTITGGGRLDIVLARYNADGSLDTSFDSDGKVMPSFGSEHYQINALILQPDGKIVVAGNTFSISDDFALFRFNADGTLDTSFGIEGKVITSMGEGRDHIQNMVLLPDGKLVVAGNSRGFAATAPISIARYNSDGSLDASFDTDGKFTTDLGSTDLLVGVYALILQPDGKLVVAGESNGDFVLARYVF